MTWSLGCKENSWHSTLNVELVGDGQKILSNIYFMSFLHKTKYFSIVGSNLTLILAWIQKHICFICMLLMQTFSEWIFRIWEKKKFFGSVSDLLWKSEMSLSIAWTPCWWCPQLSVCMSARNCNLLVFVCFCLPLCGCTAATQACLKI